MKRLIEDIKECTRCELHSTATRKVIGRGSQRPKVLFIGEAPGAKEDETGKPFCGPSGKLLDKWISKLDIGKEYAIINCLKCRPPNNADPTREQLDSCREWLVKQIALLKPEIIFLVGRFAAQEVGEVTEGITSVAGKIFNKNNQTFTIMPHPSYYLRSGGVGWEEPIEEIKKFLKEDGTFIIGGPVNGEKKVKRVKKLHEEKPMYVEEKSEQTKLDFIVQSTAMGNGGVAAEPIGFEKLTAVGLRGERYTPLHVHTTYSVGDSCTTLSKLVELAKEMGFKSLAISDHGTIGGWWEFQEECKKRDIKPLLGVEFYMADDFESKTRTRYHVLVIAKNDIGIKNIFRLNELAHSEGYYYKPRIRLTDLIEHSEGLVITSACVLGIVAQKLEENPAEGERIVSKLQEKFGEDFYLEIQLHDFPEQKQANIKIIDIAKRKGIPLVVTSDCHYLRQEAKKTHDALKAIMYNKKYGEGGFTIDTNYLMSSEDLVRLAAESGISKETMENCFYNSNEIATKCNAELKVVKNAMPRFNGKLYGDEE